MKAEVVCNHLWVLVQEGLKMCDRCHGGWPQDVPEPRTVMFRIEEVEECSHGVDLDLPCASCRLLQ